MEKLRNLISGDTKARRYRRIVLNLHITYLAWAVESTGFLFGALMTFLQHENNKTRVLQIVTGIIYFILVPSTYLINSNDIKATMVDSKLYLAYTNKFFPQSTNVIKKP